MKADSLQAGSQNDNKDGEVKRTLTEKSMEMRCQSYLSQVKARLLTETISEVDNSRKSLLKVHAELQNRAQTIEEQRRELEEKIEELSRAHHELQATNQALENKNLEIERMNKLFVDREFRIKELRDRVKELEATLAKCQKFGF